MFRVHDILEWIRILGSMPLINGSGSWIGILLFSSLTLKMPTKNNFCFNIFSVYYCLKVHLHNFPKIKSHKESQNRRNQGFSYYFCMMTEGSVSGSIPLTNGRPKNMWIRWIRIQNTDPGPRGLPGQKWSWKPKGSHYCSCRFLDEKNHSIPKQFSAIKIVLCQNPTEVTRIWSTHSYSNRSGSSKFVSSRKGSRSKCIKRSSNSHGQFLMVYS